MTTSTITVQSECDVKYAWQPRRKWAGPFTECSADWRQARAQAHAPAALRHSDQTYGKGLRHDLVAEIKAFNQAKQMPEGQQR